MASSSDTGPGAFRRPRPRPVSAWVDGWRRVLDAPAIAAGVFVMTFLLALPLAYTMRGSIEAHLGRSTVAEAAAESVDYDWWQEFTSQATGLATSFTPSILGFAATLDNISSILDGRAELVPITGALAAYLAGWALLSGGVLDRYARQRRTRAHGFFAAGGTFLFRFLRLGALAALVYWFLFAYVHKWLFDDWYPDLTRAMDTERRVFAVRVALYLLFGGLLILVNVVFDYAKIRIVVEDRRSALGGLTAGLRFVVRHMGRVLALYGLNALVFVVLLGMWAFVAPEVTSPGLAMWLAFLLGQLYVLARLLLKLHFLASQTALFQAGLAHAAYAAAPQTSWPDSPAVEALSPAPPPRPESV